ncbi:hypothetical protein LXA43DRAFT_245218 [Ganoderma leucocontextum]|nr:hypothetical protein LXA43DRAFT_245218 [Ganoderma leucocontextum]
MQLPANGCEAIPADSDQTPRCPDRAISPLKFCREHAEERRALEERERIAARDADRLKPVVEDMVAEGAEAYIRLRDVRKDERVVRLYSESLERQIGAAVALKTRFFSDGEDRDSESVDVLEERKRSVVAFLAALQERADMLERELEREQEVAALSSNDPEPAPVPVPNVDEPPAYPILDIPHPPCACTADSSDSRPNPPGPPGRCTALRLRDGQRCTWTSVSGQRFCRIHCVAHGAVVISHKVKEGMLEAQRMKIVRGEGEKARRVEYVKTYLAQLEDMVGVVEDHQRLFSCRSPESHSALLKSLRKRRTGAGMLLGELSGRMDARIAENQGQAETWATEYLAEMKQKDAIERRKAAEDFLTGAMVGGAMTWLGVPWARSAVAGVVSSLVVRKARDGADHS